MSIRFSISLPLIWRTLYAHFFFVWQSEIEGDPWKVPWKKKKKDKKNTPHGGLSKSKKAMGFDQLLLAQDEFWSWQQSNMTVWFSFIAQTGNNIRKHFTVDKIKSISLLLYEQTFIIQKKKMDAKLHFLGHTDALSKYLYIYPHSSSLLLPEHLDICARCLLWSKVGMATRGKNRR